MLKMHEWENITAIFSFVFSLIKSNKIIFIELKRFVYIFIRKISVLKPNECLFTIGARLQNIYVDMQQHTQSCKEALEFEEY